MSPVARTLFLLCTALLATAAGGAVPKSVVSLKNRESWAVLVDLGTVQGVTADWDFEVLGPDSAVVGIIYPYELYDDHFWSQPMAAGLFERIAVGMAVRRANLDRIVHGQVRREGEARRAAVLAESEKAHKEEVRAELEKLRERRRSLVRQRDDLDDRISAREKEVIGTEGQSGRAELSEEGDVDRSLETLATLSQERDELQSRRAALADSDPFPKAEVARLSAEIDRLNDRMESERRRIRTARDRRRVSQRSFLSATEDWKRLLVDLRDLDRQIQTLTLRIQELEAEP
jgi:hypothetical protein